MKCKKCKKEMDEIDNGFDDKGDKPQKSKWLTKEEYDKQYLKENE